MGEPVLRNPITGIAGCCARATRGQAAVTLRAPRNSRRLKPAPRVRIVAIVAAKERAVEGLKDTWLDVAFGSFASF